MSPESPISTFVKLKFTAILRPEEDMFTAFCPELDVASQGKTHREALDNLREAVTLFLQCASKEEVEGRLSEESWISQFETDYAPA
jgi:predicted RNase H-like HicB family nuclease